ncbi:hypothetical protein DICPUDRAFT_158182 [Dictyostelium purpureum]|uniref:Uncharacterized protein n=1 Tax=Dictyostelium purpureum TaxID=5786 RepID=F1A111_DICPU|nr:uncharacterized protein DICPUDRAFT_158182 [Dictyostelium purpureum]EGC30120.1 hypothetical protein DICPUDRAFT_158182 [Dictyostelium purpureum]|eukprot:XP_003293352.1 hypothetical protein DICPUDRAFT_158182 [Dictyostelium purpureum]
MFNILLFCIFLFIVVSSIFYYYFGKILFKKYKGCRCSTTKGEYCHYCAFDNDYWGIQYIESQKLEYDHIIDRHRLYDRQSSQQHTFIREQCEERLQLYQFQIKQQQRLDIPFQQQLQLEQQQRLHLKQHQVLQQQQLDQKQYQIRQQQLQYQRQQQQQLFHQVEQQTSTTT